MVGAIRFAASENSIATLETWALARLLAVAVIVQAERVSQQSTTSPAERLIAGPESTGIWLVPLDSCSCIFPRFVPAPQTSPLYPRSSPPCAWKFAIPTPTPLLAPSSAPKRCVQRIVQASEEISQGQ